MPSRGEIDRLHRCDFLVQGLMPALDYGRLFDMGHHVNAMARGRLRGAEAPTLERRQRILARGHAHEGKGHRLAAAQTLTPEFAPENQMPGRIDQLVLDGGQALAFDQMMEDVPALIHLMPEANAVWVMPEIVGLDKNLAGIVVEIDQALAAVQVLAGIGQLDPLVTPVLIGHLDGGSLRGIHLHMDDRPIDLDPNAQRRPGACRGRGFDVDRSRSQVEGL